MHSVYLVYIVVRPFSESQDAAFDVPELGLYQIKNYSTQGLSDVLIYAEDKIGGQGSEEMKYTLGYLVKDTIGDISESGDFSIGGNTANTVKTDLSLKNTRQLMDALHNMDITLLGKPVYIIEATWDNVDGEDTETEFNPIFFGRIDSIEQSETSILMGLSPHVEITRRSNLMTDDIPVTFGRHQYGLNRRIHDPKVLEYIDASVVDTPARQPFDVIDINNVDKIITTNVNIDLGAGNIYDFTCSLGNNLGFSSDNKGDYPYDIFCGNADDNNADAIAISAFSMSYFYTTDTDNVEHMHHRLAVVQRLAAANPDSLMRITIFRPDAYFMSDSWPNRSPYVYEYDEFQAFFPVDNIMQRLVFLGDIDASGYVRNFDNIEQRYYDVPTNISVFRREIAPNNSVRGIGFKSVMSATRFTAGTAYPADVDGRGRIEVPWRGAETIIAALRGGGTYHGDGLFAGQGAEVSVTTDNLDALELTSMYPGRYPDYGAEYSFYLKPHLIYGDKSVAHVLIVPIRGMYRNNAAYDKAVLQINMSVKAAVYSTGGSYTCGVSFAFRTGHRAFGATVDGDWSIPFGASDNTNTWQSAGKVTTFSGLFEVSGVDFSGGYDTDLAIIVWVKNTASSLRSFGADVSVKIYHAILILTREADIDKEIFMPTTGRVFNERRDANGVLEFSPSPNLFPTLLEGINGEPTLSQLEIKNPAGVLYHARLLSNYSDIIRGGVDWGKEYPPINDTSVIDINSFNQTQIKMINKFNSPLLTARQITNMSDANTDSIAKSICRDFYLVNTCTPPVGQIDDVMQWGGDDVTLWKNAIAAPRYSVSVLGVMDGGEELPIISYSDILSFGNLKRPSADDVYCEPTIKYGYSDAIGEYTEVMAITNIIASEWEEGFTPGFSDNDGINLWNKCKEVFNNYKHFVVMPGEMQEQVWINDYDTALWKINKIVDWCQKSRMNIDVRWQVGRKWRIGTHIYLALSHINGGNKLLCAVESINKRRNNGRVTCGLVFIDLPKMADVEEYIIQETGYAAEEIEESGGWNDIIREGGRQ